MMTNDSPDEVHGLVTPDTPAEVLRYMIPDALAQVPVTQEVAEQLVDHLVQQNEFRIDMTLSRHASLYSITDGTTGPEARTPIRTKPRASVSKGDALVLKDNPKPSQKEKELTEEELQQMLERAWEMLALPKMNRIDSMIKYTTPQHAPHFEQAAKGWDDAARAILERESALAVLQAFEKEQDVGATLRAMKNAGADEEEKSRLMLEEIDVEQKRQELAHDVNRLTSSCTSIIDQIQRTLGDVILYKGRSYVDKMRTDMAEVTKSNAHWSLRSKSLRSAKSVIASTATLPR